MSISPLEVTMDRIKHAPEDSPIAVFWSSRIIEGHGKKTGLDAVFERTVGTQMLMKAQPRGYIGSFHVGHDLPAVKRQLQMAIAKNQRK